MEAAHLTRLSQLEGLKLHKSLKISATLQKVCTKLSISAIAPEIMPTNQLLSSIGILPKSAMPVEGGRSAPNTKNGPKSAPFPRKLMAEPLENSENRPPVAKVGLGWFSEAERTGQTTSA